MAYQRRFPSASNGRVAQAAVTIEPWIFDMDLTNAFEGKNDPDRPLLSDGLKKKNPTKKEHVGTASVRLATCKDCKRMAYANFFEDEADDRNAKEITWVTETHRNCPLRFPRPPSFILDRPALTTLSMTLPSVITSADSITSILHQSNEWVARYADLIHHIIRKYDARQVAVWNSVVARVVDDDEDDEDDEEPASKRTRTLE
ncbi:hypothetical protein B0H13DRAFT_2303719 [Mycena leptocephala]|nr:hypothetical protein B0H13DRAFT_2303719 [Mycena leptocephala]